MISIAKTFSLKVTEKASQLNNLDQVGSFAWQVLGLPNKAGLCRVYWVHLDAEPSLISDDLLVNFAHCSCSMGRNPSKDRITRCQHVLRVLWEIDHQYEVDPNKELGDVDE